MNRRNLQQRAACALACAALGGCTLFAYTNAAKPPAAGAAHAAPVSACSNALPANRTHPPSADYQGRATANVKLAGDADTLVLLALSGGGSRSAYWAADVMLKLQSVYADQRLDILSKVNAISSVSGGSLPAAYYAISTDPNEAPLYGRQWDPVTVRRVMSKNYTLRWFGNWFWPQNIVKYWFTSFDRTDIMAQTLSDNLYDRKLGGRDLKLGDLRGSRPYLILNSTNGTQNQFDSPFTYTDEDFSAIDSNVDDYSLGRAVMGTAAFPAVFSYMTLRDFQACSREPQYVHVFDGGNVDNLGLGSVGNVMDGVRKRYPNVRNLAVILVDAFTDANGVDPGTADPRDFTDFIVDRNFLAATDALLYRNRENLLNTFDWHLKAWYQADPALRQHVIFYHVTFNDVNDAALRGRLNKIPTNFSISAPNAADIDKAADVLLTTDNTCLGAIKDLITHGRHTLDDPKCVYSH